MAIYLYKYIYINGQSPFTKVETKYLYMVQSKYLKITFFPAEKNIRNSNFVYFLKWLKALRPYLYLYIQYYELFFTLIFILLFIYWIMFYKIVTMYWSLYAYTHIRKKFTISIFVS